MNGDSNWRLSIPCGALAVAVLLGGAAARSAAVPAEEGEQEASPSLASSRTADADDPELRPGQYLGAASCASSNCHGDTEERKDSEVLQNEFLTWLDDDPHARAYEVLFNEDSERIAELMRLDQPADRAGLCLDCHTLHVPQRLQGQPIDLEEGISCEACHGPAGGWLAGHTEEDWSHQDSVDAGMVDLRALPKRGRLCTRCHLGDAEKTVDHELIAAGHPELIFELDNFTGALAPHWIHRSERHGARAWAVGQVTTFREGLLQLARRARSDRWPEFADMSCLACHHRLEDGDWRRRRGYRFRPGLPPWSPARWVVLRQLLVTVDPDRLAALDQQIDQLADAVAHMNQPQRTAEIAETIAASLDEVLDPVARLSWDRRMVVELVRSIAADRDNIRRTDVQTAEQAFLAVNSLVAYLADDDPSVLRSPLASLLDQLDKFMGDRSSFEWERFTLFLEEIEALI